MSFMSYELFNNFNYVKFKSAVEEYLVNFNSRVFIVLFYFLFVYIIAHIVKFTHLILQDRLHMTFN